MKALKFPKTQTLMQPKNLYIWDQKCFIWVFLRYNFEYLESTHPNFSKGKVLLKNTSQ